MKQNIYMTGSGLLKLFIKKLYLSIKKTNIAKVKINDEYFYKYKGQLYPEYLNKGNACQYISSKALIYCKGTGLDIGADKWPLFGSIPIRNDLHLNAHKLDKFKDKSLDYIFSSHCLEHLSNWQDALILWISKLKENGILFLYLPHKSMKLWNPMEPWVGDDHKWIPTHKIIASFLIQHGMEIIEYNSDRDEYWSFHIVAKKYGFNSPPVSG